MSSLLLSKSARLALAGALLGAPVAAEAAPRSGKTYHLSYFLPKTRAVISVAQRLTACPAEGDIPAFETTIKIIRATLPDTLVTVDAKKGLLAKRSTELKLNPNGTLAAFNASNEGQGGPVISALVKTAISLGTGVFPALAGPEEPSGSRGLFACTAQVEQALERHTELQAALSGLALQIAAEGAGPGTAATLAALQAELLEVEDELTVVSTGSLEPATTRPGMADPSTTAPITIASPDITPLFETGVSERQALKHYIETCHPGGLGLTANLTVPSPIFKALATEIEVPTKAEPGLYYRRAVSGQIAVSSAATKPNSMRCRLASGEKIDPDTGLSVTGSVPFTQLSGLQAIPIGRGGLFGSEEAIAEFDTDGVPTRLKYGGDSGAAALAGVIDTARAGYETALKAPAAEETAYLEALRRRKEIRAIEAELARPLP